MRRLWPDRIAGAGGWLELPDRGSTYFVHSATHSCLRQEKVDKNSSSLL
jgi:hypothetical protein